MNKNIFSNMKLTLRAPEEGGGGEGEYERIFLIINDNLFINIFEANCYLQVKNKIRTIKTYLQFISIKKKLFSSSMIITIMEKQKSLSYNNILICINNNINIIIIIIIYYL